MPKGIGRWSRSHFITVPGCPREGRPPRAEPNGVDLVVDETVAQIFTPALVLPPWEGCAISPCDSGPGPVFALTDGTLADMTQTGARNVPQARSCASALLMRGASLEKLLAFSLDPIVRATDLT